MPGSLTIPDLPAATILLVEVGSTAHGTGLPGGEDQDEMGVVVESPAEVLGLDDRGGARSCSARSPRAQSRAGEVPFADWWERCLALDARLDEMADDERYPAGPDGDTIEAWAIATHLRLWDRQ